MHSISKYKSVFQFKHNVLSSAFDEDNSITVDSCKFILKETSTLMINFFCYSNVRYNLKLIVKTDDNERRNVELKYELPEKVYLSSNDRNLNKGEPKSQQFQKFKLQPNAYVFSLRLTLQEKLKEEDVNFLLKIGSVSECRFQELTNENEPLL